MNTLTLLGLSSYAAVGLFIAATLDSVTITSRKTGKPITGAERAFVIGALLIAWPAFLIALHQYDGDRQ